MRVRSPEEALCICDWVKYSMTVLSPVGHQDRRLEQLLISKARAEAQERKAQNGISGEPWQQGPKPFPRRGYLHWGLKLYREMSAAQEVISAWSISWVSSPIWPCVFTGFVLMCVSVRAEGRKVGSFCLAGMERFCCQGLLNPTSGY